MEVVPTTRQKAKEYPSIAWVNTKILSTVSIFTREGSIEITFLDVGHSFDRGPLIHKDDKNIL